MLKRITLPTFSLMFLGIVYLALFFQAIANQYQTHFLTYRLSYLFIAIGMSFIHIITISQTPVLATAALELLCRLKGQTQINEENLRNVVYNSSTTSQQQPRTKEQQYELVDCKEINLNQLEENTTSDLQKDLY
jgi:cytochrome c biogenesis protein CcdA